jgi:chaperonin GroEL
MEFNQPSEIVKDLNFGDEAKSKVINGVDKLAKAVKSTLGASGKCVIYEDARGNPVITKDGVTVAESVVLLDPVENIGATLIKEASKNTVKEAGDGTTTAIVLAESLLKEVNKPEYKDESIRNIKNGIQSAGEKVMECISKYSKTVSGENLRHVSSISCNNDAFLGGIIADAYTQVGKDGVVLMEDSDTDETYAEIVDGVQFDSGLTSTYFATNKDKQIAELENPLVLIVSSKIPSIRKIQNVLEHVIKNKRALLIVANVDQQVKSALLMNNVKGNIKVNIVEPPGFGAGKADTIEDLAFLTGARVINEELGDDLDLIQPDCLGEVVKSVTNNRTTVLTTGINKEVLQERIDIVKKALEKEKEPFLKKKLQERLAMLTGYVGIIKVGGNSKIELKERKDRVEDAIYAVKAALQEGIVPGGGICLLNAANSVKPKNIGEKILLEAIKSPFFTIMANAGIENYETPTRKGVGYDVTTGKSVNMIKSGIVDPALVTKTALKNAISVVSTIISANCVISNIRVGHESGK